MTFVQETSVGEGTLCVCVCQSLKGGTEKKKCEKEEKEEEKKEKELKISENELTSVDC